jgi:transposase-like protein
MTKRKKYTKEFKLDAISLVRDQNLNIAEASRNLSVSAQMLGRWIKEEENEDGQAFRGKSLTRTSIIIGKNSLFVLRLVVDALSCLNTPLSAPIENYQ